MLCPPVKSDRSDNLSVTQDRSYRPVDPEGDVTGSRLTRQSSGSQLAGELIFVDFTTDVAL